MEVEVRPKQERFFQVVKGKEIGIITRSWLSTNANMLNMQFKRNYKILTHIWCMLHSYGVRSWRSFKKVFNPKCQEIGKCAKRNGMDWTMTTRNS
jgi:hypothetical protein